MNLSVIILTYNCADVISDTLTAALQVSDDIHIVDSFSTDRTLDIIESFKVNIITRAFVNYSDQRNWAINNIPIKYNWQLHLDADEILTEGLIKEILQLSRKFSETINGYYIARRVRFLGRDINHGGMYPIYHMRLFKNGYVHVEHKKYDQLFVLNGQAGWLKNPMIDDHRGSIAEWTMRHNRWSDLEVEDIENFEERNRINKDLESINVKRAYDLRRKYYKLPLFLRAFMLFIYRYILRFGFLDGKEGFIYYVLQTFWFRFLVDAKIYEKKLIANKLSKK